MAVTTTETKKAPPVARVQAGSVQGAIWKRVTDKGVFYSATFENRYKDGETWKGNDFYGATELLFLKEAVAQAYAAIDQLRASDKAAGRSAAPGEEG
jgi:hypothetical protein